MHLVLTFEMPPTLNDQRNLARANKFLSAQDKKYWTQKLAKGLAQQGIAHEFGGEVWAAALFRATNMINRDPLDNVNAALKYILDAVVKHGTIRDDRARYIQQPFLTFWEDCGENEPDVILLISDAPLISRRVFNAMPDDRDEPTFGDLVAGASS